MKNIVLAIAALVAPLSIVHAQTPAPTGAPLRGLIGMGLSQGGDDLATAVYASGSKQDIKAGGGVQFTAGGEFRFSPEFSLQGTLNFHVDDTNADNGSIKFQRFPVELIAYYHISPQWRVGAGARYVSGAKLSSSGAASGLNFKFDNAVSGLVEAEYLWGNNVGLKLRYVSEKYEVKGYRGSVDANHVGIAGTYYF